MKRWIHAATETSYNFEPGDQVTVYEGKVGYANYDAEFVRYETNVHGVQMAVIKRASGIDKVPASVIMPSERDYFYSLTRNDVLTKEFVAKLIHKDDSMFCDKIRYKRVDRDPGMENVTGIDADIMNDKTGEQSYRVIITRYITKNYDETRDWDDEWGTKLNDPLIDDALDVLKKAPIVYVNFAGYQRKFEA